MAFYPPKISEKFKNPNNAGKIEDADAKGTGASFVCGAAVRFFLNIEDKKIMKVRFSTNACGFAVAAAQVLAEKIFGRKLIELHGAESLKSEIENELGKFEMSRTHCTEIPLDALQNALSAFRLSQIEEFRGEKALICTCFGVSEETIESVITEDKAETVKEVGDVCNAGTGCGSCRFLIQELIDDYESVEKNFF